MKTGRVLNLRTFGGTLDFIKRNRLLLILLCFFVVGFVFGISSVGKYEPLSRTVRTAVSESLDIRAGSGFVKIASNAFFKTMLFVVAVFLFGASAVGVISVPLTVLIRGFCYGSVSAFLYSEYSLKGIAVNAVLFMPPAIIFSVALLLLSVEAICFSVSLLRLIFHQSSSYASAADFGNYSLKFAFCSVAVFASALIDAFISANFAAKLSL